MNIKSKLLQIVEVMGEEMEAGPVMFYLPKGGYTNGDFIKYRFNGGQTLYRKKIVGTVWIFDEHQREWR